MALQCPQIIFYWRLLRVNDWGSQGIGMALRRAGLEGGGVEEKEEKEKEEEEVLKQEI